MVFIIQKSLNVTDIVEKIVVITYAAAAEAPAKRRSPHQSLPVGETLGKLPLNLSGRGEQKKPPLNRPSTPKLATVYV